MIGIVSFPTDGNLDVNYCTSKHFLSDLDSRFMASLVKNDVLSHQKRQDIEVRAILNPGRGGAGFTTTERWRDGKLKRC